MKDILDLVGRVFISAIFLFEGYDSLVFFKSTKETMAQYGITWRQDMLLMGAICFLVMGGLLILVGYRSRLGAALLMIYWVPVTLIVHSFWNDPPEIQRQQSVEFMKNIAITGGLLMVLINGSGRYSIRRLFATSRV